MSTHAQIWRWGGELGMNRYDFFSGASVQYEWGNWLLNASHSLGVRKSIFQRRWYPRTSMGGAYGIKLNDQWKIGPRIDLVYASLKVDKLNAETHHFLDAPTGLFYSVGNSWRFEQFFAIGPAMELWQSTNRQRFFSWNYWTSIRLIKQIG